MFLYNSVQQFCVEDRNSDDGLNVELLNTIQKTAFFMKRSFLLLFFFLFISLSATAQRSNQVSYVNLINRANAPQIFIDDLVLPAENGEASLSIIFRFDNDFLPFKKITDTDEIEAPDGMKYFTIASLNAEIFEGRSKRRSGNDVNVASRDRWVDTLYTKTFEDTEAKDRYASGSLTNTLSPGSYNYILQLSLMESTNERSSTRQNVRIVDWDKKPTGEIIYLKAATDSTYPLMNLGDNVLFGKDFRMMIRIPDYSERSDYSLNIYKARTSPKDTTKADQEYSVAITGENIMQHVVPSLNKGPEPGISFTETESGYTYAILDIPNKQFENAGYIVELVKDEGPEPVARSFFRSYWQNMPASLLNLDIAIEHMKFIVSESKLKELSAGSAQEKEKKFRAFWEQRDPTPDTVYNELMAEYYRRIEYAFEEFSNRGNLAGHESDQGKIYIQYGPPMSKDRQFPTNGKVVEVWKYQNRTFVFEATTGFGDFVLLGKDSE